VSAPAPPAAAATEEEEGELAPAAVDGIGTKQGPGWESEEQRVKKPSSGGVRWTAEEVGVGEDAAPLLAHERGADEVRWLFRRQAEEHVYDGVVDQLRRRPCAWRRHAWNLAFRN
jgi:hypothetical protein